MIIERQGDPGTCISVCGRQCFDESRRDELPLHVTVYEIHGLLSKDECNYEEGKYGEAKEQRVDDC